MTEVMLFLHVLAAVALGFYLFLPLMVSKLQASQSEAKEGLAQLILLLNRMGQYVLTVAFITGGYLIAKSGVSVPWMIVAILLILVMLAMSGMFSKPLKRFIDHVKTGKGTADELKKMKTFSFINAATLIIIIVIMLFPNIL